MANVGKKITDLDELTELADADMFVVVDDNSGDTKKVGKDKIITAAQRNLLDYAATAIPQIEAKTSYISVTQPVDLDDVEAKANSAVQPGALGSVATSNDYNDLDNKPDLSIYDNFDEYDELASFPVSGEVGVVYLAKDTGYIYRWDGTGYSQMNASLALGETSATAYRGDRGKIAYDHTFASNNPHNVSKSQVGLGNVDNTSDIGKPISSATQSALNLKANEDAVVKLYGSQSIAGNKTFTGATILAATTMTGNIALNGNWLSGDGTNKGIFVATSGNVGIGTTAPSAKLHVVGTTIIKGTTGNSGILSLLPGTGGRQYNIESVDGSIFRIYDASAAVERLRIDSLGNVGIGTASPDAKLAINNGGYDANLATFSGAESNLYKLVLRNSSASGVVRYNFDTINQGTTYSNNLVLERGNVGIGTTTPQTALSINRASGSGSPTISTWGVSAVGTGMDVLTANSIGGAFQGSQAKLQVQRGGSLGQGWNFLVANDSTGVISEAMRITHTGNVGIGTTGSGARLSVLGADSLNTSFAANISGATGTGLVVTNQGNVGIGTTGPGARLSVLGADSLNTSFAANISGATGTGLVVTNQGNVGIGTTAPSAKVDIASDILRLRTIKTPATASATGNQGDICWDSSYVYVCVASNTWKRSSLVTW